MKKLLLLFRVFLDRRTPVRPKLLVLAAALYGLMPMDAIPDVIPFLGAMDDLTVVVLAIYIFHRMTKDMQKEIHAKNVVEW